MILTAEITQSKDENGPGPGPEFLAPIARQPLHVHVYEQIREALIAGRFHPNQTITVRPLAHALGTSAMPVREALNRLVGERALEVRPNRSIVVPLMTAGRLHEIATVRYALEGLAAAQAVPRATADDIAQLHAINTAQIEAAKAEKHDAYLAENRRFHMMLYGLADSETLMQLIQTLWLQIGPVLYFVSEDPERARESLANHTPVLEALKEKKPMAARNAIVKDIKFAIAFLTKKLNELR